MISSKEYKKLFDFAYSAYQEHCGDSGNEYRQNGNVPFINHPIWCASLLLADTDFPLVLREIGFKALLLHDVIEDTSIDLPYWVEPEVKEAVKNMTYQNFDQESDKALSKPIFIKLLILIDKISTMYEYHARKEKQRKWKEFCEKLLKDVETEYGNIRIVQISKAILSNTDW